MRLSSFVFAIALSGMLPTSTEEPSFSSSPLSVAATGATWRITGPNLYLSVIRVTYDRIEHSSSGGVQTVIFYLRDNTSCSNRAHDVFFTTGDRVPGNYDSRLVLIQGGSAVGCTNTLRGRPLRSIIKGPAPPGTRFRIRNKTAVMGVRG
jgi:hypothetical protein